MSADVGVGSGLGVGLRPIVCVGGRASMGYDMWCVDVVWCCCVGVGLWFVFDLYCNLGVRVCVVCISVLV